MRIRGRLETAFHVELPAADIDFDKFYSFDADVDGQVWCWRGARAERRGELAVFDFRNGKNGMLIKMSPSLRNIV